VNITDPKSKYILYVGYEFEVEGNLQSLMQKAIPITNYKSGRIYSYHSKVDDTSKGLWRVERDASLYNGAEFISPPILMEDSFKMMRGFFQAITEAKSDTNTRCGCHINMCLTYNGKILKMNENAIVCNIDWRLLCSLWPDRLKNKNVYCKYISHILKENDSFLKLKNKREFAKNLFNYYHGFITRKPSKWNKEGIYYELRFPGGTDYHLHPEKIETTVRHFNEVLDKSRLAVCRTKDDFKNKKIISYINRVYKQQLVEIPSFRSLKNTPSDFKKIDKLKNIKDITSTKHTNYLSKKLLGLVTQITSKLRFKPVCLHEQLCLKLVKTINEEHVVYYIIKYFVVSHYVFFKANITFFINLLNLEQIKFTVPVNEFDTDKLWVIKLTLFLNNSSRNNIINTTKNSMKSTRMTALWNKMLAERSTMSTQNLIKYTKMATKHYLLS
jgi:hypothetical protein